MSEPTTHSAVKRLALENDNAPGMLRTSQPNKANVNIK
jgi:hypothetical protein